MEYQSEPGVYYGEERFSTFQVWSMALTNPSEETYRRIVRDPDAGLGRAVVWFLAATLVGTTITVIANVLFGGLPSFSQMTELTEMMPEYQDLMGNMALFQVICIPVWTVVGLLVFLVHTGAIHFVAGALGGEGTFSDLIYAFAAYTAPFTLVYNVLLAIPIIQCFAVFLSFYALYLGVVALKVVHRFDWGKSIATFGILIAFLVLVFCIISALMARAITEMFQMMGV
jgi:hypothetical protein